jgi:hypothetical protein
MRRSRKAVLAALAVSAGVLVSGSSPAQATVAAGCGPLAERAHWPMDEPAGASAMRDVDGGHDGAIVNAETGLTEPVHSGFGAFYRFGRGTSEFPNGSMVTVADNDSLDPGSCDFAVEVSVNWDAVKPDSNNHTTYNVAQKGLSTAPANWKIEVDGGQKSFGQAICTFDGVDGHAQVRVKSAARVPSARWTKLRCERRGNDFLLSVNDGTPVKLTVSGIGPIENSSPLTVGTKKLNDSDTFPGYIDELVYSSGR